MRSVALILGLLLSQALEAATPATIQVQAGTILRAIQRDQALGTNLDLWKDSAKLSNYVPQWSAAGIKRFRYPGGALADVFHWNSNGSYNAAGRWNPSNSAYTAPGFRADLRHRGTTDRGSSVGSFPSKLTDNDLTAASEWRSNTLSAHGINPWFYLDLGSSQTCNRLQLTWGASYATDYRIQNYTGGSGTPYTDNTNNWNTLLTVSGGSGGTDLRSFTSTSLRFLRVELLASSGSGYHVREAQIYNTAVLRSSHSTDPQVQSLCVASPTDIASDANATGVYLGFDAFMSLLSGVPGAEAVITVNLGTGTPEEAAAWVHYANIVRGYGIRRWEIGNEVEGVQMPGGPFNGYFYAERLRAFAAAMKAEDPSILIEGPVLAWLEGPSHLYDGTTFTTAFFSRLQAVGQLGQLDVLNFHDYPNWANNNEATSLATWRTWAAGKNAYLLNINATYYPGSPRPVHLSEFNTGDATRVTVKLANALWLAAYMGEFLGRWGDTGYSSFWFNAGDMYQAGDGTWGDHGMIEGRNNAGLPLAARGQPRAVYHALSMLKDQWMTPGVSLEMLSTTTSSMLLPAFGLKRGDGHLTLLVANHDPATTFSANIQITGYAPNPASTLTTFAGAATAPWYVQNYVWLENGYNSYATTDLSPTSSAYPGVSGSFTHSFPPYSISVFDFTDSAATFTPTPVVTPTSTATPITAILWDDFEQGQALQTWQDWVWGTATSSDLVLNAGCAEQGSLGASESLSTGSNGGGGFIFGSPYGPEALDGGWLPHRQYRDLSAALAVEAWVKCSSVNVELKISVVESPLNGGDSEEWVANNNIGTYVATPNVWQKLSFPSSSFVRIAGAGDNALDLQAVKETHVNFWGMNQNGVALCVDDIRFVLILPASPTPTPTRSGTPSPTFSATRTTTLSSTPSSTSTQTASPSSTRTVTATSTPTFSATGTPTYTSTISSSPSATPSLTNGPSSTSSATPSPTRTASPSPSATTTPTPTATRTSTPTHTTSASASPTSTARSTATPSQTSSSTRTTTPTSTSSSSATPSPTASISPTWTSTSSATGTPPPGSTATSTSTISPTATGTETPTATWSESPSPSATPSATPTWSATPSATGSATPSASATPSSSASPSSTATISVTWSGTPSATSSPSSTGTPPPGSTATSTSTPTATWSESASATRSATASPSATPTFTATPTLTFSSSVTPTFTATTTSTPSSTELPSATATPPPGSSPTSSTTPTSSATSTPTSATPASNAPAQDLPRILDAAFAPQPASGSSVRLACKLSHPATWLRLDYYTRDLKHISSQLVEGSYPAGWGGANFTLPTMASGMYYARLKAGNALGASPAPKVVKLMVLR